MVDLVKSLGKVKQDKMFAFFGLSCEQGPQ